MTHNGAGARGRVGVDEDGIGDGAGKSGAEESVCRPDSRRAGWDSWRRGVGWWQGKAATALLRLVLPSRQGVLQLNLKMLFFTGHVYNKQDMRGIESCIYYLCHCMILFHNYSQYNFTLKSYITKYVGKCLVSCKVALHMLNKFSVELPE